MADLKMVTEGELLSAGYSARTTNNRISDDYCPTVEFFMTGWCKEGYLINDINNRDGYELFALSEIVEAKEAENPTWDMPSTISIDKYGWGCGADSHFINITDNDDVGWKVVAPEWMDVSGECWRVYTDGTFINSITGRGNTEVLLSTDSYDVEKTGIIYLKSLNGNETYAQCSVSQLALPSEKTSMTIYFKGMKTDLDYATNEYKYLYIWDNNAVLLKLGNDFNPSLSQKYVTITKDLITTLKQSSSSYENVTSEDDWKIVCSDMQNAEASDAAGFETMANSVDVKNVIGAILTAWDNGNESVTITVSYAEEVVLAYPSWNLTTGSTLGLSSAGTDVNFTVTDDDHYGYSFSADSSGYFFDIYDNVDTKLDWATETEGTNDYTLRVNNNTSSSRSGHVYLVYNNQDNTDKIKNGVLVQQNAYVEPPKKGEVYSIYSNGYHSPTQLTNDINSTAITANNITVEIEWAPNKNYKETGFLIPIFGYDGHSETRIYAEYISGDTYRIHLKVRDNDISGATINAAKLTSSNLCTIVHKITKNGKTHSISINNAYGSTTTTNTVATAASFYSIWAGGVRNYSPESNPYSYFGSVKLTVGNIITQWKTWTTNGTICGWVSTTDTTQELKTASNYTPGPYKYS